MPLFFVATFSFSWFAEAPLCSVSARPRPPPRSSRPPRALPLPAPLTLSAGLGCPIALPAASPSRAANHPRPERQESPTVPKNSEPRRNTTNNHRTEIKTHTAPRTRCEPCWRARLAACSPRPLRCGGIPDASRGGGGGTRGVSRGKVGRSLRRPWAPPTRKGTRAPRRNPGGGAGEAGVGSARRAAVRLARAGPAPVPRLPVSQAMASETLNKGAAAAGASGCGKSRWLISKERGCYPVFRRRELPLPTPASVGTGDGQGREKKLLKPLGTRLPIGISVNGASLPRAVRISGMRWGKEGGITQFPGGLWRLLFFAIFPLRSPSDSLPPVCPLPHPRRLPFLPPPRPPPPSQTDCAPQSPGGMANVSAGH